MIIFDPLEPFPYINDFTYAQAKEHARQVDQWLGFNCQEIENQIQKQERTKENQELWVGLDVQSLQTPYIELRNLLRKLEIKENELVVDLGCAYARLAHVMKAHYPHAKYLGLEIVKERVLEAQRVLGICQSQTIIQQDLNQSVPPIAEHYFLYDYGSNAAISKTLNDLLEISRHKKIQVIGRGKASRSLIHRDHPWLCEVQTPQHFETYSIYKS